MPRGGKREKAGRKSEWPSGCPFANTTVIRIPKELKEKVVEFAKKLDAGQILDLDTESNIDKVTESKNSGQLSLFIDVLNRWIKEISSRSTDKEWIKVTELVVELTKIAGIDFLPQSQASLAASELVTDSVKGHKQLALFDEVLIDSVSKSKTEVRIPPSLTVFELAKRLNVSVSTIGNYKNGLRSLTLEEWSRNKDPDKVSWRYERKKSRFYPVLPKDTSK